MNVSPEYGQVHLPVHDGSQLGPVQLAQLQLLVTVVLLQTEKYFTMYVEKYSVVKKTFYRLESKQIFDSLKSRTVVTISRHC